MSTETNVATARRLLEQGFGEGDLTIVDECVSPQFVEHQNGAEGSGPGAMKRIIRGLHESFSPLSLEIEDAVAAGDDVWVRAKAHGVNSLPIMGGPPTGGSIDIDVIDVIRFSDGLVVEHWGVADRLGMLQQLGLARPGRREG
jgi:predicted ester cyclase